MTTEKTEEKQLEKITRLIYLSNPALTAWVGILGFLEPATHVLASAIGVTVVSAAFETINRAVDTSNSVINDYQMAVNEAVEATRYTYRNRSSRLLLFEKLHAEELPFDVELKAALEETTKIRDEYKDNHPVQEIINVFDAHFKLAAAKKPSLSRYLVIYKTEAIVEMLEYAEKMANEDRRVLNDIYNDVKDLRSQADDIQAIVEKTNDDVGFLRQLTETGMEVGARAANWASRSMIVYVLAIFASSVFPFAEIMIDLSFFVFVFLSEMMVESVARANKIEKTWMCMVMQSAILTVLYCMGQSKDLLSLLLSVVPVCIAVGARYLLDWLGSMDER